MAVNEFLLNFLLRLVTLSKNVTIIVLCVCKSNTFHCRKWENLEKYQEEIKSVIIIPYKAFGTLTLMQFKTCHEPFPRLFFNAWLLKEVLSFYTVISVLQL